MTYGVYAYGTEDYGSTPVATLPNFPFRSVEWEFTAGTWTDVADDVVSLSCRHGRNREAGSFETGHATFTVRNDARKYDPDNTAGPFYGRLRPNRRVRFRATYGGVTYPVFQGYVDRIVQNYGGPNDATATVDVSDLFKILNRVALPTSAYAAEVLTDQPAHWWRLGEAAGSTTAIDRGSSAIDGTIGAGVTPGVAGLISRESGTATQFALNGYGIAAPAAYTYSSGITVEFVIRPDSLPPANTYMAVANAGPTQKLGVELRTTGHLQTYVDGVASVGTGGPNALVAGQTYHIAIVFSSSGGTLYRNGVNVNTDVAVPTATTADLYIGGQPGTTAATTLQEFAIYGTALTADRVAAHAAQVATPWNGDLPGPRIARVLDQAKVPAADRSLDTGTTTLQSTYLAGNALDYAQKVEETDRGAFFVARDGKATYVSRASLFVAPYLTSRATLVDDDAGAGLPYRKTSQDTDEAIIVTRAQVSRDGSVLVVYGDAAAQAEFQVIDESHTGLLHNSDAYSLAYAQWVVNTHKAPGTRVGAVELTLARDPTNMYPALLALEIGDRVTYKHKPQNVGTTFSQDMRVEAIAHDTGPKYWTTRLQLTPFDLAGGVPIGVWDTSLWDQAVWGL